MFKVLCCCYCGSMLGLDTDVLLVGLRYLLLSRLRIYLAAFPFGDTNVIILFDCLDLFRSF